MINTSTRSMNNLPQELIDRISNYLDRDDLKNTLLLSRQFQYAAEEHSKAFQHYTLTESNFNTFLDTYIGRRFRYLRYVYFPTSLPALEAADYDAVPCRETAEELQLLDREFTRQINFLFSTLRTLESNNTSGPGNIHLSIYTPTRAGNEKICLHHRFVSWRVHLLSPKTLPNLACVRHLTVRNAEDPPWSDVPNPSIRKLDLRVLLDLSSKLPNSESLQCLLGGDEWYNSFENFGLRRIARDCAGPRRDSRHDFGKALQALPSMRHVELDFLCPLYNVDHIDQRRALPNLTIPAKHDPFSTSLRILSYHLRSMKLRVVADEALFWPPESSMNKPSWPNLESVHVMFHMASPSGSWYFGGCPGMRVTGATKGFNVTADSYPPLSPTEDTILNDYGNDGTAETEYENGGDRLTDVVQFRVYPAEEVLVPFLTAFAKAAASMPSLKDAALWAPLSFHPGDGHHEEEYFDVRQVSIIGGDNLAWGVAYTKPGVEAFDSITGENFSMSRQMWWRVAKWRPDPELHRLFQQIGREHGEDLIEYWNTHYAGEGLDDREFFEAHGYFEEAPDPSMAY